MTLRNLHSSGETESKQANRYVMKQVVIRAIMINKVLREMEPRKHFTWRGVGEVATEVSNEKTLEQRPGYRPCGRQVKSFPGQGNRICQSLRVGMCLVYARRTRRPL